VALRALPAAGGGVQSQRPGAAGAPLAARRRRQCAAAVTGTSAPGSRGATARRVGEDCGASIGEIRSANGSGAGALRAGALPARGAARPAAAPGQPLRLASPLAGTLTLADCCSASLLLGSHACCASASVISALAGPLCTRGSGTRPCAGLALPWACRRAKSCELRRLRRGCAAPSLLLNLRISRRSAHARAHSCLRGCGPPS